MAEPIHCWEDRRDFYSDWDMPGGTCLLPDGHDGPHEFTDDSDIVVRFASRTASAGGGETTPTEDHDDPDCIACAIHEATKDHND